MNTVSPITTSHSLAIYMEGALGDSSGKMGHGVLRYSPCKIACVIDSVHAGKSTQQVIETPRNVPIVASLAEAQKHGANVLLLGIAPSGGKIPSEWFEVIDKAVALGFCIVNGLHDLLAPRYPHLSAGQWVWDIRREPEGLNVATGGARELSAKRVLMVGTDMSIGKMTAGLELYQAALKSGVRAEFVATGQIGITIMGKGVPLDAVRVDYACGAVEAEVMRAREAELIIIEGQGSILHPGSTGPLPLMRGSCPTHLVLCHRAGMTHLQKVPWLAVPPLSQVATLYQDIVEACGTYSRPEIAGIALNTAHLSEAEAFQVLEDTEEETCLPCTDVLRFGVEKLLGRVNTI